MAAVKIIHVVTVPQSLGFIVGQVTYMKAKGFEVHAISSPGEWLGRFADQEGVRAYEVQMTRRITAFHDLVAVVKMVRLFNMLRPGIVHAHTPKGGLLGMVAAWLSRVPVRLYHVHGLPMLTASGFRRRLLRWSEMLSCRLSHQVLCVSGSVRDVVVKEGVCPAPKIKVLLGGSINGVDAVRRFNPERLSEVDRFDTRRRYGIRANAAVLGFVGRVVREKGVAELGRAWQILREEHPDLHLMIVGPFEPQDPVPPDVKDLLIQDPRVHLIGEDWDTPPLYTAMDIVVLPTYREGFPVVPLEAAALGLPVVATRVPGCVDAVQDGVTGTLVPARDVEALAEAIRAYVKDPALRRRHGAAGRVRVLRGFRQEDIWRALHFEYERLLRQSGLAAPQPAGGGAAGDASTRPAGAASV